ncbi:hypothetical protein FPOAC2_00365 [Fusarium poae]|uniref:Uncharacterized protein n=1 Tax=Fusarium poae TaxID=36050 RepID=A0A1B8B0U9_FUSPO|nr:hypothetical protein FPOAC1_000318 [Fusarium poae]KAG8674351.1 hypothetical protein FPOAC1_000318 [Fusarium poae]OBS26365.1 hypothetical protein FPOA_00306 [Fusarium poae]
MRKRKSLAADSDSFTVRWQSVVDMNTPSADIMSSPDPLNDTVEQPPRTQTKPLSAVPPSTTRRIIRSSQRSSRYSSAGVGTSPRRQTFELEVGDNQAPQRLLVTVETEEPSMSAGPSSARRKLFQDSPYMPAARRREMATTTTTVPLKKAIEEQDQDPNATPRRRGRPRKTNGTPLPSAGIKRKGTPIAGSPRTRRRTSKDTDTTETIAQPTPGTKRRGRPPKNRSIDLGRKQTSGTPSISKSAQQEEDIDELADAGDISELPPIRADDSQADNDVTLVITPSEAEANQLRANRNAHNTAPAQQSEPDSDIWMATLDDEPTPRPATKAASRPSSPEHGRDGGSSDFGDYGYGPAGSDVSSADEHQSDTRPGVGTDDTVAAGEEFSMIFMDSLPSLQASLRSSTQQQTENDIGEETSMIINNTLESLRQSLQDRDRPKTGQETAKEGGKVEAPKGSAPAEPQQDFRQSTIRPPLTFSPKRQLSSSWWQSPRRMGSSPLRHQVLLKSNVPDAPETTEYRGSPLASNRHDASHLENENSNAYDDSFSEIPDAVLTEATPRRPRASTKKPPTEKGDIQMEDAQLIQLEDEPEVQEEAPEEPEVQEKQQEDTNQPTASNASAASRSDAGRLPTPDDTSSNFEVESDNNQKTRDGLRKSTRPNSSRGSSLKNPSPEPVTQVQTLPEPADEIINEAVTEANEDDELLIDFDAPAQEPDDHSDADHQFLDEPDDHSDIDEQVFEETVIADPVEEEEEMEEEEEEEEPGIVQELPKVVKPHQPRLSLEAEIQQPEVTPMNQLTSPIQEPQTLPELMSERARRSTLSPAVRAGRALQSVTSDPPSPEARDQHLRSPFRSSVTRDLGPRESQNMRRTSASPRNSRAVTEAAQISEGNEAYDDPFGTNTRHTGQPSFMEALERSSRTSSPRHRRTASRDSAASSTHFQAPSEGGMSWVQNEGPISPNLRGDVPLEAFARSTVRQAAPPAPRRQADEAADVADDETEDAGDDLDLWEFEAQRSSPRATQQQPAKKPESPYRARGKIPSTWGKQTTRETQQDGSNDQRTMSEIDETEDRQTEAMEIATEDPPRGEEYSLLNKSRAAKETKQAPATAKANRFDLSAFFSSPGVLPGMLAEKFSPLKMSVFGARPAEPEPEPVETTQTLPTSSMFPQVPQQELPPRGKPRLGFFSPVRPAQPPARQEPSEHSEEEMDQSESSSNQSSSDRRSEASSVHELDVSMQDTFEQPDDRERSEEYEQEDLDEEGTEEEVEELQPPEMPSVPQKANFTPERRRPAQSFFKASARSAVAQPEPEPEPVPVTGEPTPPRMQLSHADIHRWQQETSNASEDSPEPTPAKPAPRPAPQPLLRPLPPRNASPIKSSLRSPLKPHTPGRVVEFTSSVLSPIEQARVRHQRRLSNSSAASQSSNAPQRPRIRPPPRQTANKENPTTIEVPASNAGPPKKQPRPAPLSQTVWTRKHWLVLNDLLQERRQRPFTTYYERCSDKYLGKTVASQGEAMTLERWHLDCVDAFKAQVGGWDEGALAKRLFALILGEQRRSQDASSSAGPRRVMFH